MSSLAPEQLAYIVTHGELLVMLSLRRLEMMLDASAEDAPAPSAEELAAAEAVTLAELARQQQQWLTQSVDVAPVADAHVTLAAAALPDGHVDLGPEIEDALAHAYASIPARTQALQGADTASLVLALAALPEALPALTQPMDAAGLSAWLDLHEAGDPALGEVVAHACALGGSAD